MLYQTEPHLDNEKYYIISDIICQVFSAETIRNQLLMREYFILLLFIKLLNLIFFEIFKKFSKKLLTNLNKYVIISELQYGGVPEWPKGADCKSVASCFDGSNPSPSTKKPHRIRCEAFYLLLVSSSLILQSKSG